jgi:hypothetical protein
MNLHSIKVARARGWISKFCREFFFAAPSMPARSCARRCPSINENIFNRRSAIRKYYQLAPKNEEGKKKVKQRSEVNNENRRKFLFILFVIISFLHYEYLSLLLRSYVRLTQKKMQQKERSMSFVQVF